jgi:hypothetical protein
VDPQGADTGAVTLGFANATTIDSGALSFGTAVTATNTVQNQQNRFTFSGTAGQIITMLASATYINDGGAYIYIYNPDGSTLTYLSVSNASTSFLGDTVLPVSGTYVVLVVPQGTTIGSTTLTLYNVPAAAKATATIGGTAASVKTTVPGQNAVVSFSGTAGMKISLVMTGNYALNGMMFGSLQFAGQALTNFTINNQSTTTAGPVALPSTGTYQIVITPYQASVGTSSVTIVGD